MVGKNREIEVGGTDLQATRDTRTFLATLALGYSLAFWMSKKWQVLAAPARIAIDDPWSEGDLAQSHWNKGKATRGKPSELSLSFQCLRLHANACHFPSPIEAHRGSRLLRLFCTSRSSTYSHWMAQLCYSTVERRFGWRMIRSLLTGPYLRLLSTIFLVSDRTINLLSIWIADTATTDEGI